jgi:hypothetical protein
MKFSSLIVEPMRLVYRFLLRLLPRSFRREYGEELMLLFRDLIHDAHQQRGLLVALAVSLAAMWDIVRAAAREHWEELLWHRARSRGTGPCTPRAQAALQLAHLEAELAPDRCCREGHILLGLLREAGGVAARVLHRASAYSWAIQVILG